MDLDIKLNEFYSKEEIEKIFSTNFGSQIRGINLRTWDENVPYIILFSRIGGPYSDKVSGDWFYYDGEGLEGDQRLTPANKALINANEENRIVYGFRQEVAGEKWRYIGILEVIDYDYVQKNGRKVYEFKLRQNNIEDINRINKEEKKLEQESSLPEPILNDERKQITSYVTRKVRDEAFSRKIKRMYNETCVVCKKRRFTNAKYPEVQSAHIYPVEKNGSDDLRNGIALCRLHHWAFDGGLFTISDDLTVVVRQGLSEDANYDDISNFDNTKLLLPTLEQYKPLPIFLKRHRIIHGFE